MTAAIAETAGTIPLVVGCLILRDPPMTEHSTFVCHRLGWMDGFPYKKRLDGRIRKHDRLRGVCNQSLFYQIEESTSPSLS